MFTVPFLSSLLFLFLDGYLRFPSSLKLLLFLKILEGRGYGVFPSLTEGILCFWALVKELHEADN